MSMDDLNGQNLHGNAETAVQLFGDSSISGDFPVLKAFQQYVDAEQSKARKRMLTLCAFFAVLLALVVIAFTVVLGAFITRNQALSDRLLDLALKNHAREIPAAASAPQVIVQPPATAPAPAAAADNRLDPILDRLSKIAENLNRAPQPPAQPPAAAETAAAADSAAEAERAAAARRDGEIRRREAQLERLRAQEAEMKRLRETAAAEKEKRHREEVERHRRRLYPEYYAPKPPAAETLPEPAEPAAATEDRPESPKAISYFNDGDDEDEELAELIRMTRSAKKAKSAKKAPAPAAKKPAASVPAAKKPAARAPITVDVSAPNGDELPMVLPDLDKR